MMSMREREREKTRREKD